MRKRQCRGCGSVLQSNNPKSIGYLPEHLLTEQGRELICQRCYRIKHYGENILSATDNPIRIIGQGLDWADGLIIVTDLMDFEASFPNELRELSKEKPTMILVNKVDLLPPKTGISEVITWVKTRLSEQGIKSPIYPVSGISGLGIAELSEIILNKTQKKWLILGVTNVGKSTLIGHLLSHLGYKGKSSPTISRFPGTTVERIQWKIAKNKQLSDSPGLIPVGRLIDQVPEQFAPQLVPAKQLSAKVYQIEKNSTLVIPGLAALTPVNLSQEVVMIGITASEVEWQRGNQEKISDWLAKGESTYQFKQWDTHKIKVSADYDLIIHGLGWVSVRKQAVECELVIPKGVNYSLRLNLIGKK